MKTQLINSRIIDGNRGVTESPDPRFPAADLPPPPAIPAATCRRSCSHTGGRSNSCTRWAKRRVSRSGFTGQRRRPTPRHRLMWDRKSVPPGAAGTRAFAGALCRQGTS
jgi:hypothetical protein